MAAHRILDVLLTLSAWIVVPIQLVTTFVLSLLVTLTFGLLLIPLSLVWIILLFPLLGFSKIASKLPAMRNPIGVLGVPWALVANTYVCLIPSMGEQESRAEKLMLCQLWPYTWEFWEFRSGRRQYEGDQSNWETALVGLTARDPIMSRVVRATIDNRPLDSAKAETGNHPTGANSP